MNPYEPPSAPVDVSDAPAVITVRGLVRLYQGLVVGVTVLGILFYFGVFNYFATPEMLELTGISGAGSLIHPETLTSIYMAMEAFFVASAIGLFFFTWWSRPLFVATYASGVIVNLLTGAQISLPVAGFFGTAMCLMHGAILALSFLPPISGYFARERSGA